MKSLDELRAKILPIPTRFAADATDISPATGRTGEMDFENGFTRNYASKDDNGKYLERRDFNRLGEMASREIYFREAGGEHSYSTVVTSLMKSGFPEKGMLTAFDGTMQYRVESTIPNNTVRFHDDTVDTPNIIDGTIDCPVSIPGVSGKMIAWRTVNRVYGREEGLFSLSLDFSRAETLKNGSVLKEDSMIIGSNVFLIRGRCEQRTFSTSILTPHGNFEDSTPTKGKSGDSFAYWPMIWVTNTGEITIIKLPTFGTIAGSTNFNMTFFAKKGSTFTGRLLDIAGCDVYWTAVPIKPKAVEATDNDI